MHRTILASLALVALLLAGCSGRGNGDGGAPLDTPTGTPQDPSPSEGPAEPEPEPADPGGTRGCASDDPKFHTHDYWGLLDSLVLFEGQVQIGESPEGEATMDAEGARIGQAVFTPEDDGNDDGATDKTDVVYQGTKEVLVVLEWADATIPGLAFQFKHANNPQFSEPVQVQSGQEFTITLQSRWADMAHQDSVSRWAFQLVAYDAQQSASPFQVHAARGAVDVYMEIHKGDASQIDPPHPAFYCTGPVRYAGDINGSISQGAVVTAEAGGARVQQQYGNFDGLRPPAPAIVPTETTTLRAWLHYNYTGPAGADQHALGLKFHGADTVEYTLPEPDESSPGRAFYLIPVDGTMTDSPYAHETDWRYGVYPIVNGQAEQGDFQGDFHIYLEAVKG